MYLLHKSLVRVAGEGVLNIAVVQPAGLFVRALLEVEATQVVVSAQISIKHLHSQNVMGVHHTKVIGDIPPGVVSVFLVGLVRSGSITDYSKELGFNPNVPPQLTSPVT